MDPSCHHSLVEMEKQNIILCKMKSVDVGSWFVITSNKTVYRAYKNDYTSHNSQPNQ